MTEKRVSNTKIAVRYRSIQQFFFIIMLLLSEFVQFTLDQGISDNAAKYKQN